MNNIKIFHIEDNAGDVELVKRSLGLAKLKNPIEVATDGQMALDYLETVLNENLPDLIILDLNLPKISGLEVLKAIKTDNRFKLIPVVILSSSDLAEDIKASYNLNANCFVSKPIELDEFIKAVQSIESFWLSIVKLPKEQKPTY